jgi:hypothetical protein
MGSEHSTRWLPTGNSFVFRTEKFAKILAIWREVVEDFSSEDLRNLPFTYRCVKCGLQSKDGVGRWGANRHASYFLERVTALTVASLPELKAVALTKTLKKVKKSALSSTLGLPYTARIYTKIHPSFVSQVKCNHIHFGPGKR